MDRKVSLRLCYHICWFCLPFSAFLFHKRWHMSPCSTYFFCCWYLFKFSLFKFATWFCYGCAFCASESTASLLIWFKRIICMMGKSLVPACTDSEKCYASKWEKAISIAPRDKEESLPLSPQEACIYSGIIWGIKTQWKKEKMVGCFESRSNPKSQT